jgi:alcohol dehydrogenase, propanol-preferring
METPKPKGPQVLVKILSSGVCHSDIHLWEGGYQGLGGQLIKTTDRGIRYPLRPGQEITGVIDSIGEEVKGFAKEEKIIVFPLIGEGLCPACRAGEENLCDKSRSLRINTDGGYAEYILVPD